jgi:oxalate decarboxylase/phosphoglucose isomerase-like protein (cupin superfamily)
MTHRVRGFWFGVVVGAATAGSAMLIGRVATTASAQESEGSKPTYTIALENDRVRVRDVTFPPGVLNTGMHTHEYAHVGVILTKGTLVFTDPTGKVDTVKFEPGSVGFREANATHMVANPGPDPMRVIEVELKQK